MGGVGVKFWTFNGWERATKIEQLQKREECWSLGDNVTIECPPSPMKKCLPLGKLKNSAKVSASVQSQPDSSG